LIKSKPAQGIAPSSEARVPRKLSRREFLAPPLVVPFWRPAAFRAMGLGQSGDALLREFGISKLTPFPTPNEGFFVRNHFAVPQLAVKEWKLRVMGAVGSPRELDHDQLLELASRELAVTLECAGNGVGTGGVSTATWTGTPLAALLRQANLGRGVKHIRLVGADRGIENTGEPAETFARSIPLEKALHPDTLLAFHMNGVPLPPEHGFPVRAIVPGWYGMDSVKWLTRIEALERADTSFYMTQRYVAIRLEVIGSDQSPVTRIQVKSMISQPAQGEILPLGPYTTRGAAWAGENNVAQVEVSTDGGENWNAASLEGNPRPYCWRLWNYRWLIAARGTYALSVRATDDQGNAQPATRDSRRLDSYELNWRHSIRCEAR
jgi:DMSO/TMAO reductase YedYZ molybdopterin-dependent catalytic subunit